MRFEMKTIAADAIKTGGSGPYVIGRITEPGFTGQWYLLTSSATAGLVSTLKAIPGWPLLSGYSRNLIIEGLLEVDHLIVYKGEGKYAFA